MKNSTMRKNPKDKIEAIVDALLESDQMESTARYLTNGRRFAHLETEEIKKRWRDPTRPTPFEKRPYPAGCRLVTLHVCSFHLQQTTDRRERYSLSSIEIGKMTLIR
jgi:hypothetical protein